MAHFVLQVFFFQMKKTNKGIFDLKKLFVYIENFLNFIFLRVDAKSHFYYVYLFPKIIYLHKIINKQVETTNIFFSS